MIMSVEKNIVMALKQVYDPEIPVNVYDLGLIYEIKVDENRKANIKMTLTAPNCPMVDELLQDVYDAVSTVPSIDDVAIELTFDPPWDKGRMSEEALFELGML
ncbi:MAG: FeS assembly SUF system protein [Bacteroidetes bacterium GWF2_41_61]|jgi:FeS assembly SUF system protein|nr:MAG: FeS assembly SUF system protein [Bacteroidetes bacterium GWE2_40_15]OFY29981.1 MAG: FeS assembly SUF system protein [Bacteroidetes bacterium GWF2_41_61]OFY90634.1 MAG: FeS assembly SUF system protein [Bacteroidetes bacterium RIFOXYA12_FULL_40_10]